MIPEDEAALPWDGRDVPRLMTLDGRGRDRFASRHNQANLHGPLFGGQVLGQGAAAAMATSEGRTLHSLHGYFLRAGSADRRILFEVERLRDGRRFSTRRVVARQDDAIIFEMTCSFFVPQQGFTHQLPRVSVPPPEDLEDLSGLARSARDDPFLSLVERFAAHYPVEVRPVSGLPQPGASAPPRQLYWIRVPSAAATDDPLVHQQLLAWLSDFWLLAAALMPHRVPIADETFMVASLDHAMWFHRPARVDEWLLYQTDSPSAEAGIGLARGLLFDRAGRLIATVAQEALLVPRS